VLGTTKALVGLRIHQTIDQDKLENITAHARGILPSPAGVISALLRLELNSGETEFDVYMAVYSCSGCKVWYTMSFESNGIVGNLT
jgi:hypothetical protein